MVICGVKLFGACDQLAIQVQPQPILPLHRRQMNPAGGQLPVQGDDLPRFQRPHFSRGQGADKQLPPIHRHRPCPPVFDIGRQVNPPHVFPVTAPIVAIHLGQRQGAAVHLAIVNRHAHDLLLLAKPPHILPIVVGHIAKHLARTARFRHKAGHC